MDVLVSFLLELVCASDGQHSTETAALDLVRESLGVHAEIDALIGSTAVRAVHAHAHAEHVFPSEPRLHFESVCRSYSAVAHDPSPGAVTRRLRILERLPLS